MSVSLPARIYEGVVLHRRFRPRQHEFRYRVFSLYLDVDALPDIAAKLRLFSIGKFHWLSITPRDFGAQADEDLGTAMRRRLLEVGVHIDGPIRMLAYPRMFGYAFNPLTVFYCFDEVGTLRAVLYQVRNTFGESHAYLAPTPDEQSRGSHQTKKIFHVSPFIDMGMQYHFALTAPAETLHCAITVNDDEGPLLHTSFKARARAMNDAALAKCLARYPAMTFGVIAAIHWQALRLLLKGVRLKPGQPAPTRPITLINEHGRFDARADLE